MAKVRWRRLCGKVMEMTQSLKKHSSLVLSVFSYLLSFPFSTWFVCVCTLHKLYDTSALGLTGHKNLFLHFSLLLSPVLPLPYPPPFPFYLQFSLLLYSPHDINSRYVSLTSHQPFFISTCRLFSLPLFSYYHFTICFIVFPSFSFFVKLPQNYHLSLKLTTNHHL